MYIKKYVIFKNPVLYKIFNRLGKGRMGTCIEKISSNLRVHLWRKEIEDLVFKILYYFCNKNYNGHNQENYFKPIFPMWVFIFPMWERILTYKGNKLSCYAILSLIKEYIM